VLVKWSGLDESLSTWEDEEALRQQFPQAPAWGHAATQGGGGGCHGSPPGPAQA
jgi:hypothetical protein